MPVVDASVEQQRARFQKVDEESEDSTRSGSTSSSDAVDSGDAGPDTGPEDRVIVDEPNLPPEKNGGANGAIAKDTPTGAATAATKPTPKARNGRLRSASKNTEDVSAERAVAVIGKKHRRASDVQETPPTPTKRTRTQPKADDVIELELTVDSQRSARSPPATMTTGSDISAEKVRPGEDQPLVHADTSADAEKLQLRDSFEEGDDDVPPKRVGWQYWLIYAIFVIQGVGILLPWNMFLTIAPSYYIGYKLNPVNGTETDKPYYQKNFFSYLGLFSQMPNLLLNILNVLNVFKGGLTARIYVCIAVILLMVGVTDVFALVDTTEWPEEFFWLTMFTVVVLNAANGLYQNSIYGFVSDFPAQFINAIVIGNNACGILVSVIAILGIFFAKEVDVTALIYFSLSLLIVTVCLVFFFVLGRMRYAQHFRLKAKRVRRQEQDDGEKAGFSWTVACEVFKQTWKQMVSVFLTFFVTLAIFPAVLAGVKSNGEIALPENLFTAVIVFLLFNVAATAGNILASFVQWPSPKYLIYPVAARLLFIPTFLLCNFGGAGARRFPAYITSDYVFAVFIFLFSITQGYFSSLSMMYAPKAAEESKQRIAGMMSGFFLVLGITVGVNFTFLENYLVLL